MKQLAVLFALVLPAAMPSLATTLTPGSTVTPSVFTSAGMAAVSPAMMGTISPGTFSATYWSAVFSDTNNVFCSSCLDFVYTVTNSGPNVNERTTMFNFDSFLTNVGYIPVSGDVAPVSVDRTMVGSTIGFSFNTAGLAAGQTSDFLVIQTNATSYTSGLFSIQDGSAGTGGAYQPTTTPEPSSLLLLGTGLIGLARGSRKIFS